MKKRIMGMAITAISVMVMGMTAYAGTWQWQPATSDWLYLKDDGQYASYEWIQDDDGSWYYFGRYEDMQTNCRVDGYYLGADGKMVTEADTGNPLSRETLFGTSFIKANSYEDNGDYYKVNVSLYDSNFAANEDYNDYQVGDSFQVETEYINEPGTVTDITIDTGGNVYLTVRTKDTEYYYAPEYTFATSLDGSGEGMIMRLVAGNVEVIIPKNIEIVPEAVLQGDLTLDKFLNEGFYRATPVFEGSTVVKLYDHIVNYAG